MALLQATYRDVGAVTVLDLSGRITLGEGSALLRSTIRELLADQRFRILVDLSDINYIDSSGIGELVSAYTTVKNRGGELKLLHLTKKVHDLLQITKLYTVFDVHSDEVTALRSFDEKIAYPRSETTSYFSRVLCVYVHIRSGSVVSKNNSMLNTSATTWIS